MEEALGTYWAKSKDLANRGGHFVRRNQNIQGYITSAAVDNQAKKPPKLSVMTMKWSKIQSDKPECCALGNIKGQPLMFPKAHAIKIYVIQHPCDTNIQEQTFQVSIWLRQKHLLVHKL